MKAAIAVGIVLSLALAGSTASAQVPDSTPDGEALYRQHCRTCHGARGTPPQRMVAKYKDLQTVDSAFLAARSNDSLVVVIRDGVGRDMKPFKEKLTAPEIAAVAQFLRTLGASKAP
jgi:mono/diheme cytochrome c family protein